MIQPRTCIARPRVIACVAAAVFGAGACGFSAPAAILDDELCPWPYEAAFLEPCEATGPALGAPLVLGIPGMYTYDTDSQQLTDPEGITSMPPSTMVGSARTIWTEQFAIAAGTSLRAIGASPLRIVSTSTIAIDGMIDVSSRPGDRGAGAEAGCPETTPPGAGAGLQCTHGGSGGGGGGFGAAGGNGGVGGGTRNCFEGAGVFGGAGGLAFGDALADLRGGCRGRAGGFGDGALADAGPGGSGGGSIQLVARDELTVRGTIHAGGGGGGPGLANRAGAGGGGSGGMIQLDGSAIVVTPSAVLAANGGGGGGGCNDNNAECAQATAGADGQPGATAAEGGAPAMIANAGTGGAGGYVMQPAGQVGTNPDRGGGGGGGGVGVIRLNAGSRTTDGATVSPAHTP